MTERSQQKDDLGRRRLLTPVECRAARGFTLLELMVVVAVVGISASLVLPTFTGTIAKSRENGATAALAATLARARVTAMKRHAYVKIDTSTTNVITLLSCPARYGSTGCISSYSDQTDAVPQGILRLGTDATLGVALTAPSTVLVFTPQGFPVSSVLYEYELSHSTSSTVRKVIVSAAGEISVQ